MLSGNVVCDMNERGSTAEHFQLAIEAAPTGMIMVDQQGAIVLVNAQVEKLFGYARAEIIGQSVELLVPARFRARHPGFRTGFFNSPVTRPMGAGRDLYGLRKDGIEVPIEIGLNPLQTPDGNFVLCSVADITERKRATEQFRLAIEAAPTGMIMVDQEGDIVLVNVQVEKLFGYPREELIGKTVEMLIPQRFRSLHPDFRNNFFAAPLNRPMGAGRDLYGLRKDGTELPIEIGLNPLQSPTGEFVLCSVADITERKRAQQERDDLAERRVKMAELSATLKERETLLQEIHHRVKNNLQVISSLVNLQLGRVLEKTSHDVLRECQARVQAIALIHEMLYQSKDYLHVPFPEYASRLAKNVFNTAGIASDRISLELHFEQVSLHVDKAVPCGLILNELIMNALKHAFPGDQHGTIWVEMGCLASDWLWLVVRDNGVGIVKDVEILEPRSLGMQLVLALAKQIKAKIEVGQQEGTWFKLTFPADA